MVTVHNAQLADFAGVPVTLVYDVPNPTGNDVVCTLRKNVNNVSVVTLPSCTGSLDVLTPALADYSQDAEAFLCNYQFEAFDRTAQKVAMQTLFQGCGRPYALTDARALTRPAHGPVPAAFRDHCGGGRLDACVEVVAFEPGQLPTSFAPYFVQVTWGDGTEPVVMRETEFNRRLNYRHTYAAAGTYTVRIVAVTPGFGGAAPYFDAPPTRAQNRYRSVTTVTAQLQ